MDKRVCVHGLWPDGLELYPRRYSVACSCVEVWVLLCYPGYNVSFSPLIQNQILTVELLTSAFIVQVYGAASAESNDNTIAQTLQGIHIYMGGVAIQQLFIFCFCGFAFKFWRRLLAQKKTVDENLASADLSLKSGFTLLYALIGVLILISVKFPVTPSHPELLLTSTTI